MHEIGGYIEFEHFHGSMLHGDGIKLDCGRSCLAYLIKAKKIKKIAIPSFLCDSVFYLCERYGVQLHYYQVGLDFLPKEIEIDVDEYLYLVNYYGQLDQTIIEQYRDKYKHVIIDNSQAYFDEPVSGVDTLYTCRKFFGVPDGGILYTDAELDEEPELSESWNHMEHIFGRFERSASEFYSQSAANNKRFMNQPIRTMSKLTENLLHGIDYNFVKNVRTNNFNFLADHLSGMNKLHLKESAGAFAYPLLIENAEVLRKNLIQNKVFVPVLWPNAIGDDAISDMDKYLAKNILPLPCDQRYTAEDMQTICELIGKF